MHVQKVSEIIKQIIVNMGNQGSHRITTMISGIGLNYSFIISVGLFHVIPSTVYQYHTPIMLHQYTHQHWHFPMIVIDNMYIIIIN